MTAPVAFDEVARALAAGGSAVHAAEAHGCLCGAFCARRDYLPTEWLEELMPDPESGSAIDVVAGALGALYVHSRAVLADGEMEFTPLLPDDDAELQQRVESLAAWCLGFLYGVGAAGTIPEKALGGDVREFLADLAQLSRAGNAGATSSEVEEEAYAELVEYVRVGAQLVYDELEVARASQPAADSQH
jgi:uncharacterized protein YgfB (UPF0149 family)